MPLSDEEIKELRNKAQACLDAWRKAPKGANHLLNEALGYYDKLIENAPPNPEYYKERSEVFFNLGFFHDAREDIGLAIKLNPNDPHYYSIRVRYSIQFVEILSDCLYALDIKQQLLRRIIADCNASLEKNPTNPFGWFALMAANILTYNWDVAISYYGSCKSFITKKEDQLTRAWLGCTALALAGDTIEASDKEPLLDNSTRISIDPLGHAIIIFLLHRCYVEEYEHWQKAIDIQKLFFKHLDPLTKVKLFPSWDWHNETSEVIDKELELNHDSINELFSTPLLLHHEPSLCECAIRLYEKIKIIDPDNLQIENKILRLRNAIAEYKSKEEELHNLATVMQSNQNIEAIYRKCDLLKKLHRYEEIVDVYEMITSLRPDNAELWCKKGCILAARLKRYKEALKALEKATELKPDYTNALYARASIHYKLRHYEDALQDYETVTRLNPQHGYAWFYRGNISQFLCHYEKALEAYDKAIEALSLKGHLLYDELQHYRVTEGVSQIDEKEILYQKATVYSKKGDKTNCINNLSQAIKIDSDIKIYVEKDEAFKNLWEDEDFKRVVG